MKSELLTTQRRLVSQRLLMADVEVQTKYVFPFVDEAWSVAFYVVDAMTLGARVLRGALEIQPGVLVSPDRSTKLEPMTAVPTAEFDTLVHFDPWWAFRGIGGVPRDTIDAALASNIAGTFDREGTTYKLHDLEFDARFRTLEALVGKDPLFRPVRFREGDLDLLRLRKPPRT